MLAPVVSLLIDQQYGYIAYCSKKWKEEIMQQTQAFANSPTYQAYQILHLGFAVAPILFGLDKFFYVMAEWDRFLAPVIADMLPVDPRTFMMGVGVVEILAGLLVAIKPRYGGYLVMAWLWAIIANLLLYSGFYDIALRDFGLSLGALALARLSEVYDTQTFGFTTQRREQRAGAPHHA